MVELMTQEEDRFDELLKAIKRSREELKLIRKTVEDQSAYQRERGEAVFWEELKSQLPPEMHSEMEELLRDGYNGDVEQLARDWMDKVLDLRNEE